MAVRELAGHGSGVGVELLEGDQADVGVVEGREEKPSCVTRKPDAFRSIEYLI